MPVFLSKCCSHPCKKSIEPKGLPCEMVKISLHTFVMASILKVSTFCRNVGITGLAQDKLLHVASLIIQQCVLFDVQFKTKNLLT